MATTYQARTVQTAPYANGDTPQSEPPAPRGAKVFGLLRITIGSIFLWAFLDKLFALGFTTGRNPETGAIDFFGPDAWINGASPTEGFLQFATKGPFAELFQGLAGQAWVDWAFMGGLLLIGTALILGIGMRLATIGGVALLTMMYLASAIWPEHHPVVDDHVVQSIALIGLLSFGAGRYLGLGRRWEKSALVKRFPVLK